MNKLIVLLLALTAFAAGAQTFDRSLRFVYKLHGQTRRFDYTFTRTADGGIKLDWTIERNLKLWHGSYTMQPEAVENGTVLSLQQPDDGNHLALPADATFALVPRIVLAALRKDRGTTTWDDREWTTTARHGDTVEARAADGTTMTVLDNPQLPLILEMKDNTDEVNWRVER